MQTVKQNQRISNSQKNADNKQWYKQQTNIIDNQHNSMAHAYGEVSNFKKMKVNYDLFNNILDLKDFEYVCKPFGAEAGELPAKMINRDIVSGKIKAMLGMEMKRPFSWNVIATNPEATTRKEQEEFKRIREFVVSESLKPIRLQIEQQKAEEAKGRKLTPDEQQQIQQEIDQELKAQTPEEVKKYMTREHQDPAEVMSQQLLEYLIQKCDLRRKFNTAFKHGLLSASGIMYVGVMNGEPEAWNVNSIRFNGDNSPELEFVEDGDYASCEYRMTPSQIIRYFGDELTQDQIDKIYSSWNANRNGYIGNDLFMLDETVRDYSNSSTLTLIHCVWKSLRKIGFLTYKDPKTGEIQEMIVDENYKLNKDTGDIKIEWEWIPEVYETWKIRTLEPIYLKMQPIPGQFKDLDNIYYCKLPYYGVIYDNLNSQRTSLMDRLKIYQYYYNIVMYRLELLLASDKGKKVLMNINMIPDSAGIDIKKWQYFMESTPYMWYDPSEEGTGYADVNTVAKVIDLSLVSDIQKYMEIAEYLRTQCGRSVGISDQVEGQIGPNDSVGGTRTALIQSSHILEPYFELHSYLKRNVLQALIETAKIAYSGSKKRKLTYFLDDMSRRIIDLDVGLLDNSTLGIFVSNSAKAEEAKDLIRQLTHAALQNQKVELSDVISVIRQEGIVEAEETLKVAEARRNEYEQQSTQSQIKANAEEAEKEREFTREKWQHEKDLAVLKEEEKRETVVVQGALVGASFNPDQDADNDGLNDFMEVAKYGLDAEVKRRNVQLQENKLEHQKMIDDKKLKQQDKKLSIEEKKLNKPNTSN